MSSHDICREVSTVLARRNTKLKQEIEQLKSDKAALLECVKWYASDSEEYARRFHMGLINSNVGLYARECLSKLGGHDHAKDTP